MMSKEKIEDERVENCRFQAFQNTLTSNYFIMVIGSGMFSSITKYSQDTDSPHGPTIVVWLFMNIQFIIYT